MLHYFQKFKNGVMAHMKNITGSVESELLLTPTDTKMAKVLEEGLRVLEKYPEIGISLSMKNCRSYWGNGYR